MKILFVMMSLFFVQTSFAMLIDKDDILKKIVFHPTPNINVQILETSSGFNSSGIISISSEYNLKRINDEKLKLTIDFPDYEIKQVDIEFPESIGFLIGENDQEVIKFIVKKSNFGIYVNFQESYSGEKYLKIKNTLESNNYKIMIQAKLSFEKVQIINNFKINNEICRNFSSNNLYDQIKNIFKLNTFSSGAGKNSKITNADFLNQVRLDVLGHCYEFILTNNNSKTKLSQISVKLQSDIIEKIIYEYVKTTESQIVTLKVNLNLQSEKL